MSKKLIVIGGVAAGMSAASKARRTNPNLDITVYTDEEYVSYAGCGLPYFIGGRITSKEGLLSRSVEEFSERDIDVQILSRVEKIDPGHRTITIVDQETGASREDVYDYLVIATGARALVPPLEGLDLDGIYSLRTIPDSQKIKDYLETYRPHKITIIGGGYIGLEMVENFLKMGCQVTLIEKAPHIIPNMDDDMAKIVHEYLEGQGIEVRVGETVRGFSGDGSVEKVLTDRGEITSDFVLLSVGVIPNSELAKDCGIELGERNAILVNRKMETSIPGIYSAGDCATAPHIVTGKDVYIPLGTTANKQGKIAGENIAGGDVSFNGILGTGIARVMEMEVSRTGLSERECQNLGIKYIAKVITSRTAAHYCPTSGSIHLKLVADADTGCLLGAQIAGFTGSAMRIDMMAVAITTRSTIHHLIDMDLAYSPPFSPVWDPVLIALNQFD